METFVCDHNDCHFIGQTSFCLNSEIKEMLWNRMFKEQIHNGLNGKDKLKFQCKRLFPNSNEKRIHEASMYITDQ